MSELPTLTHVRQHQVDRRLHDADRTAREHQPLGIEAAHQDPNPPVAAPRARGRRGCRQSSKTSSHVLEPRIPSFSSLGDVREPLHAALHDERRDARRRARRPGRRSAGTRASTSASGPFVIHIFVPFATPAAVDALGPTGASTRARRSRRRPRSSRARRPALPRAAPGASARADRSSRGSQRLCTHRFECAAYDRPTDAEPRESSSTHDEMLEERRAARPPSASGTVGPRTPRSPSFGQSHRGNASSRSIASACGRDLSVHEPPDRLAELLDRDALGAHSTPCSPTVHTYHGHRLRTRGPDGKVARTRERRRRRRRIQERRCPDFAPTWIAARRSSPRTTEAMRGSSTDLRGRLASGAGRRR